MGALVKGPCKPSLNPFPNPGGLWECWGLLGSLAGQLPIETGEGDGKGLQGTQRVPIV